MTKKAIISLFKKHRPKTPKEARALGLSLNCAGSGAFREVYVIGKKLLVVKFPLLTRSKADNIDHAQHEIYVIRKINKTQKYAALRPFVPVIHYADYRHGVLLTDYYYHVGQSKSVLVSQVLSQVADAIFDDTDNMDSVDRDVAGYNIMQTKAGMFKLIDLGLL